MRLPTLLVLATASALALAHCSHDSNTLTVSPPLPPAEEPSDDTPGAYVADAGIPGAAKPREDSQGAAPEGGERR